MLAKSTTTPIPFPQPDMVVNRRNYWRLSTLLRWERQNASGADPQLDINPTEDSYLNSAAVKKRYGGVSTMWLHRKMKAS
jgi:hypothetical protein